MSESNRRLTADEELSLARRIKAGDLLARQELVVANLGLVKKVARKFERTGVPVPFDDLVQEGNLGLIRAAADFDPDRGRRFASHAYQRIWSFMLDALGEVRVIRVSRQTYRWLKEQGRLDEIPECSRRGKLKDRDAPAAPDPFIADDLAIVIRRLNHVEAWLIRERYGIGAADWDGSLRSFDDLSRLCGISKGHLSRVEKTALSKLRRYLNGEVAA